MMSAARAETLRPVFGWFQSVMLAAICILVLMFYASGSLETPASKENRIQQSLKPFQSEVDGLRASFQAWASRLERLETDLRMHQNLGGHAVMDERMRRLEKDFTELQQIVQKVLKQEQ